MSPISHREPRSASTRGLKWRKVALGDLEDQGRRMGRSAPPIHLLPSQRRILEELSRSRTLERRLAERVQIVLGCDDGKTTVAVAASLGVDPQRVARWRRRFSEAAPRLAEWTAEGHDEEDLESAIVDLLGDEERSGCPPKFTALQLTDLIALACQDPKQLGLPVTHWTPRELALCAQQLGIVESISPRHVARFFGGGRSSAAPLQLLAQPAHRRPGGAPGRRRADLRGLSAGA